MDNIKGLVKEVNQITAEFGSPEEEATIVTCPKCGSKLDVRCYSSPVAMIYPPPAPATIPAVCPICRAEVYSEKGYSCRVVKIIEREEAPTPPVPYVPPVPIVTPTPPSIPAKIASKLKDYFPYVALAGIGSLAIYFLITAIKPKKTARGKYIEKYLKERRI